ncbi:MAG TPA: response regulator transcription factor [Dehalococcoidia bacterium]|nr:response regulator transcription factor [Dehalococcoidia bacterium]
MLRPAVALGSVFAWLLSLALAGPLLARAQAPSLGPLAAAEAFALAHGLVLVVAGLAAARVPRLERLLPWGGPLTCLLALALAASSASRWGPILTAAGATSAAAVLAVTAALAALPVAARAWAVALGALVANVPLYLAALPEHPLPDRPLAVVLALGMAPLPLLVRGVPRPQGPPLEWPAFLPLLLALWGIYLVGGLMYGVLAPELGHLGLRLGVIPYMAFLPASALAVVRLGMGWPGRAGPALLGVGFAASALVSGAGRDVVVQVLVVGGYALLDVFFWTALGEQGQPRVAYALGLGAMVLAIFTGMVLGGPAGELAQGREQAAALMAAMALLVATTAFPAWRGAPAPLPMGRDGTGLGALSERERDVLRLLAQGLSNKEIAQQLSLSEATVRKHLERIYRKLAVPGRAAAVARYLQEGQGGGRPADRGEG